MKKVLITGVNSYVGNSLETWLQQYPEEYKVDKISVRHDDWKEKDFSQYDSIVHVAGIAHQKETKKNEEMYYKINRDLTIELAKKAKNENVEQFIFLSTMSVYGLQEGKINEKTPLKPNTHYGKSKKEAEIEINKLEDSSFKVAIIRPPMIYGKDCPGNYKRLKNIAIKLPLFPKVKNRRSIIFIDNLSMVIEEILKNTNHGLFFPQNKEYISTSEIVEQINIIHGKKIILISFFNILIKLLQLKVIKKVFGDLTYDQNSSIVLNQFIGFKDSIRLTEEK